LVKAVSSYVVTVIKLGSVGQQLPNDWLTLNGKTNYI